MCDRAIQIEIPAANLMRYDGTMNNVEREGTQQRLQKDASCRIALITSSSGSVGIDLTVANLVLLLHSLRDSIKAKSNMDGCHHCDHLVITQKLDLEKLSRKYILMDNFTYVGLISNNFDRPLFQSSSYIPIIEHSSTMNIQISCGRFRVSINISEFP